MRSIALLPSIGILVGTYAGIAGPAELPFASMLLIALWAAAAAAWWTEASRIAVVAATAGYLVAGAILGAASAREALAPTVRTVLDAAYGGFSLETLGPPGLHPPVRTRVRLVEDAAQRESGASLVADAEAVNPGDGWQRVSGGVRLTVAGATAAGHVNRWRAGRLLEAPVSFRRPTRYFNDGVPDFERDLALGGIALIDSVKSGLLVDVVSRGNWLQEGAAHVRAYVRAAVQRHVGWRDRVAGAIVTAILIGDRTTLPDDVRERLQAAGTYHVIAISGGNIAILAALIAAALFAFSASGRRSALAIICGLAAYALIVSAGPSVWRATLTATVYLGARLLDHRSPPWNAMAVSAALLACLAPLDVRDAGFALTFGATAAILEASRRMRSPAGPASWIAASVAASLATEVVLLPISAVVFSRVTAAGLVLNLLAVPLMTVTQVAGLAVVMFDSAEGIGARAGMVAAAAASGLVESARLVDMAPWLAVRVPPPSAPIVAVYYAALGCLLWIPRVRVAAFATLVATGALVLSGVNVWPGTVHPAGLRLTMFDVGQGDALLLQMPDRRTIMVDAGGAGFDGTAFDIGGRVLAPALWARGVMRVDRFAITHGDPDHIGGALPIIRDFAPGELWLGVEVPNHLPSQAVHSAALAAGTNVRQRLAGWNTKRAGFEIRVLHPPVPDWQRPRVRNDDSLVLEVLYGDAAILLTGDISREVEQTVLPMLSSARLRILKIAHHGSRTSTSQALLDAWRPQVALISCGRGNRFGHPTPEVIRRLEASGARIYRTDRDGQVTVDTDGRTLTVRTYLPSTEQHQ